MASLSQRMGVEMNKRITSIEEFERTYLPKAIKNYPIRMRVTKEERDLILRRRGNRWTNVKQQHGKMSEEIAHSFNSIWYFTFES